MSQVWLRLVIALDRWLTPVRVRRYPLLLLLAWIVSYSGSMIRGEFPFDMFGSPFAMDFSAQLTAGRIALDGEISAIHDISHQRTVQQEILGHGNPQYLNIFISPPVAAFIYAPFAVLPYMPAAVLWTMLSAAMVVLALRLLWPLIPALHDHGFARLILIAFSAPPVFECLQTGQDSLLTLLIMAFAVRSLVHQNELSAGIAIGLGMFKPQLFVLFPVMLIAQRRWRALGACTVVGASLAAISMALMGADGVRQYLRLLRSDWYVAGIARAGAWNMQSIAPMVRNLFPVELHTPLEALILLAGAAGVWGLSRRVEFSPGSGRAGQLRLCAMVVLATALVDPHFFLYDCTILLIAALILLADVAAPAGIRVAVAATYVLLALAPPLHTLALRLPAPFRIIDTQWSVLVVAATMILVVRRFRQPDWSVDSRGRARSSTM